MVIDKRDSQKGNLIVEIEDEQEVCLVIMMKSDENVYALADQIVLDDILLFEGRVYNGILIAKEIIWPDIPIMRNKKTIEEDLAVAYLSDLHVGSKLFMEKEFNKFLDWINGNGEDKELAGKIKYISISGDIVDGIGIYPRQEDELVVKDIYKQYGIFMDLMEKIPDYIKVIVSPGNHDAVRRAQPQPQLPKELLNGKTLNVGSPSWIDLEGFKHLIYHGDSLDSIISSLSNCDHTHPEVPMIELLKRRNLSPIYGRNPIVPEKKDYLFIDQIPDVLHMGHVHKNGYSLYRGTHIINSGTFQERTNFQIKQGHIPTPGIVPILCMKTGEVVHKKFVAGVNYG
jgi:DNA polymerase II small subunit